MEDSRGFTLLELLVVVGVIAILATLALPGYFSAIARDQAKESIALVDGFRKPVENYYALTGEMPEDNAAAGIPEPEKLLGNYVDGIELENGAFHISFGNKAAQPLRNKILTVRAIHVPDSPASPVSWLCGHSAVPEGMEASGENRTTVEPGLLPFTCRGPKDS